MDKERLPFGRLLTSAAWPFVPLGLVVLIVGFMFAWVMRDGLGPDSHRTYGPEAWSHFLILYVPIASLGLFLLLYGLVIFFLGLFTERLSCLSRALILMLAPVAAIGFVGFAMTILTSGKPAGQPHINTLNYSIEQYTKVVGAIETYRIDHGHYPSDLASLIPRYLSQPLDIDSERFELVEYLPLPSVGEPFTFYAWGHNTQQGVRQIWEEWELRLCRVDSCLYPSEYYPPQRINESWILIYRPESRPLISRPFAIEKEPETTPLPGWRYPTSEFMFVGIEDFPDGWHVDNPERVGIDPTVNMVSRHWWQEGSSSSAWQIIRRAYYLEDAREAYAESLDRIRFLEMEKPSNNYPGIDYHSGVADQLKIVCGYWDWARCRVAARYQNYIVEMQLDLETISELNERRTQGLTRAEIRSVVEAMDSRFTAVMNVFYPDND